MSRTKERPRGWLKRLADPRIISWPALWLSITVVFLDGFPTFFGAPLDGSTFAQPQRVALSTLISQTIVFSALFLARITYLSTHFSRKHQSVMIWTFVVASFIAHAITDSLVKPISANIDSTTAPTIFDRTLFQTIALCVIGIVVSRLREYREAISQLETAQTQLATTRAIAQQRLASEHSEIVEQLETRITATVTNLTGDRVWIDRLRASAEDLVRPLSHQLATEMPNFRPPVRKRPLPSWRKVLQDAVAKPLIDPMITALTTVVLAARLTVSSPTAQQMPTSGQNVTVSVDVKQLAVSLLMLATIFVSIYLPAWLVQRNDQRVSRRLFSGNSWVRVLISILFIAASSQSITALPFLAELFDVNTPVSPAARALLVIPLLLVALITGISRFLTAYQTSITEQIEATNKDLAWEIAQINEKLWQQRRQLSRVLHGPLQATINAGAIQLELAHKENRQADALIPPIRASILESFAQVKDLSSPKVDVTAEFDRIQSMWSAISHIAISVSDDTLARLHSDPGCAHAVVDIVGEACANSAIHGQATQIHVTITPEGDRSLQLVIADNGKPVATSETQGLGTQLLSEVTTSWDINYSPTGTTLTAVVPVS